MARHPRRRKPKIVRFYRSVTLRILLAIVVPPVLLLCAGYNFVKKAELDRIRQVGETRLAQLSTRTAELLEREQGCLEKKVQSFAADPDVVALLEGHGNEPLEALSQEHGLQTIAVLDSQGQIRSVSGVSPQVLLKRFPRDVSNALERMPVTRFTSSSHGVVLMTVMPMERRGSIAGALLVTQQLQLGAVFENALLVHQQSVQSGSAHSVFLQPFVQHAGLSTGPRCLLEGSVMLGTVPLPGMPPKTASVLVGVHQRDMVIHYQNMLRQVLRVTGGLLLLLPLGGLLLSRHLMGPVYSLIGAAQRVMDERDEVAWPPVSRDEFGVLNGALQEMTARMHRSLAQSEEARAEAERASRVKTDFLANISHELRTPLNGIIGMTDALMDTPLQDRQKGCIRIIRMSSDQLITVIGDIFDASRIETKALKLKREEFDLAEMLADFVALTRMKAQQKGLSVQYHFSPGTPGRVIGDRTRIRQILSNLVNNAIKFTAQGTVELYVRSRRLHKGMEEFVFTVKDTGMGMEQWKVQSLFQAFEQADTSSTRRFGGLGLGLTITSKITEKMSGKMAVLSEPGKGSSFSVMLPLALPDGGDAKTPSAAGASRWTRAPRVLVAEDNKLNQIVVRRLLEKLGCQSVVAANGIEALERCGEHEFDLALMDCQMPEMDGFAATRKIHERSPAMPVIALTAHALESDRQQCREAGMVDHITKPVKESLLLEALQRHLTGLIS